MQWTKFRKQWILEHIALQPSAPEVAEAERLQESPGHCEGMGVAGRPIVEAVHQPLDGRPRADADQLKPPNQFAKDRVFQVDVIPRFRFRQAPARSIAGEGDDSFRCVAPDIGRHLAVCEAPAMVGEAVAELARHLLKLLLACLLFSGLLRPILFLVLAVVGLA